MFSQTTDFNCNATICYGIGGIHQKFIDFQKLLNTWSAITGTQLVEDGYIGDKTVTAVLTLASWIQKNLPNLMSDQWRLVLRTPNKETVAKYAPELTGQLGSVATVLGGKIPPTPVALPTVTPKPPVSVPVTPTGVVPGPITATVPTGVMTPVPGAVPPTATPGTAIAPTPMPEEHQVWPWVVGGVAAAGAIALVVGIAVRRKH
jgi:hypothetical protein